MSNFLVHLTRRAAGMSATKIEAPAPLPFGAGAREHADEFAEKPRADGGLRAAEELATGDAASPALSRPSFADEIMELPSEPPVHHDSSIQRLSDPERGKPVQPSIGERAVTIRTPSLAPPQSPRQHVTLHRRETEVDSAEPPNHLDLAVPPVHTDREVTTEIDVDRARRTSPVAQETEPVGETARHAVSGAPGIPILVTKPDKRHLVSTAEPTAERPRLSEPEAPASALPAPTIRPALADSPNLLQFPKLAPASSPTPPSQLPIHVRIGRVEVRAATAPTPTPAGPGSPAPLGFDGYYRVRNYRG
jgi:hypothetical protein